MSGESDPMGKWEKRFIFDYIDKWYIHKSESDLENETYKIFSGFEYKTVNPFPTRGEDLWTCNLVDISVPAGHSLKIKNKTNRRKIVGSWEKHEKFRCLLATMIPILVGAMERSTLAWKRDMWNGVHPEYRTLKISLNIYKSSGEL